jgi:cephalosporin-C deacetylase-like acetyl esterase
VPNPKSLRCIVAFGCLLSISLLTHAGNAKAAPQTAAVPQASAESAPPPETFRVMPLPGADGPEITPYLLYQTSLAWQQDGLRQARWSRVKTEDDLLQLQAELRKSVLEMIGGLPTEKTELHATITGKVSGEGFHVEKLLYQSIPGLFVTALVYVPEDGVKVHPAILVAAGHSPKGKIYYQDLCQRLVKRGYLVLSWDPIGQGERSQFWDAKAKKSRYNLICAEHAVMGNLAYLAGTNLARWEIWDGIRGVDYLISRPDVDRQRINLTGTSGGGFQAALLGALDDRIKVIIPSCYITALPMRVANRMFVDPDSDPEQDLFGFLSKGVDHAGLLLMMYPRAVMIATATLDFFPVQGGQRSYSEVRTFYDRFGHADRIGFAESYNQHQYSLKNQESALNFLDRFNELPIRHGLPKLTAFNDAELLVTKSGQVSVDYKDAQSLVHFIATYSAEVEHRNRETLAQMYTSEQDPEISSWSVSRYTGSAPLRELRWEVAGTSTVGATHIDRYVLHHSTYLEMPLLHFHRDDGGFKGALLWFSLHGKASDKDWAEISRLLSAGYEVFSFDFRGLGETRMNYLVKSPDDPELVQGSSDEAYVSPLSSVFADGVYNSLLTGRPYFLQMMDDIKIAELFIHSRDAQSHQPLIIAAPGDAYALAMRFQEIDREVKILPSNPSSKIDWSKLVKEGEEQWPIGFLLPSGALLP